MLLADIYQLPKRKYDLLLVHKRDKSLHSYRDQGRIFAIKSLPLLPRDTISYYINQVSLPFPRSDNGSRNLIKEGTYG